MVNSVLQTLYVSLIFEMVGYMWTFIILGSLATGGKYFTELSYPNPLFYHNELLLPAGSILSYFYPDGITSEDFRDRFQKRKGMQLSLK